MNCYAIFSMKSIITKSGQNCEISIFLLSLDFFFLLLQFKGKYSLTKNLKMINMDKIVNSTSSVLP